MATKIKGIYKSFKYITQIFVVKERDMEIGYPTDVKHVAHIGWDGPAGSGPSWMTEFKNAPDFSTSIGSLNERRDPNPGVKTASRSSQEPTGSQPTSNMYQGTQSAGVAHVPKKPKRKKVKSTSSPKSSSVSSRQSRAAKSKATDSEREATPIAQA